MNNIMYSNESINKRKRSFTEIVKTQKYDSMAREGMITHLLKAVQKNIVVEHEHDNSLFQKLNIHWLGHRILELWVAWEDGEMDFIFPENPDLLFHDKLEHVWQNWEDHTNPFAVWLEQFLLVYSEASRNDAILSEWQERSLETLDSQRKIKYDVAGNTVMVVADAMVTEFSRARFPSLSLALEISLSPKRYLIRNTRVRVTSENNKVGDLQRLLITDKSLTKTVSDHLSKHNSKAKKSFRDDSLDTVIKMFENMVNNRIKREYDQTIWLSELHVVLISHFGFQALGEIIETRNIPKRERGRIWHFILNLQLTDLGDIAIPWEVKIECSFGRNHQKLLVSVTTFKTIAHKLGNKQRVFDIDDEDKERGFYDLVEKVRTWVRGVTTNNNLLRDIIEHLYNGTLS